MERIVVLGCGGAGKTRLAREIGRITGLPVVHLDPIFWRAGWTQAPPGEAARELAAAVAGERWVLDGNFLGADRTRFERADAVVFLDVSRKTCLWRVFKRRLVERQTARVDLPKGCREGLNLPFLRWIWRYPRKDRPRVLGLLAALDGRVEVHRLRSRSEVRRFLRRLPHA